MVTQRTRKISILSTLYLLCTIYPPTECYHRPSYLPLTVRQLFSPSVQNSTSLFVRFVDDDRVVPLHSFKHAATLQHLQANNPHPLLIRLETKAGHGSGKSTEQMSVTRRDCRTAMKTFANVFIYFVCRIVSAVDKFAFIVHTLGLKWGD